MFNSTKKFSWHYAANWHAVLRNLESDIYQAQNDVQSFTSDAYKNNADVDFDQLYELEKILKRAEAMIEELREVEAFYTGNQTH